MIYFEINQHFVIDGFNAINLLHNIIISNILMNLVYNLNSGYRHNSFHDLMLKSIVFIFFVCLINEFQ